MSRARVVEAAYVAWRKSVLKQVEQLSPAYGDLCEHFPEWAHLESEIQQAWAAAVEATLRTWLETEAHDSLLEEDGRLLVVAGLVKVGRDQGEPPLKVMRMALAGWLMALIAPDLLEGPKESADGPVAV